jgi:hypothetical protein
MNQLEQLRFSAALNSGMDKYAALPIGALMKGLRAGASRVLPNTGDTLGWLAGHGANLGEVAGNTIGRTAGNAVGTAGANLKRFGQFMTKERHLPDAGFTKAFNQSYDTARPTNTGFLDALHNSYNEVRGDATARSVQGAKPYAQGPGFMHSKFSAPTTGTAPRAVPSYSDIAAQRPSWERMKANAPMPATPAPEPAALGRNPMLPAVRPTSSVGAADHIPNWTRGRPVVDVNEIPAGAARGTSRLGSVLNGAQKFWNNSSMARKGMLGYGAVTGATLPSNIINNEKYDWQEQHPIMSWAGRTFAGMPEYHQKSYLLPSFLQH